MNKKLIIGCIVAVVVAFIGICLCLLISPILLGPQIGNVFSRVTSGLSTP